MAREPSWWLSPYPVLKLTQVICALIVVIFFIDGRAQWWLYTVIFLLAFLTIFGNVMLTLAHYFEGPRIAETVPWLTLEFLWSGLLCCLHLLSFLALSFDWWRMRSGEFNHHKRLPPANIGRDGWIGRVGVVAISSVINFILFAVLLYRIRKYHFQ